jgi:hypothetical protein
MPTTTSFWELPVATLEKALDLRKQIEALKAQEAAIMGGQDSVRKRRGRPPKAASVQSAGAKLDGRKGKRSPATIAKMKAAAKARWAAKKGDAVSKPGTKPTRKKRRTMSPEARAKIAAAQKARWAKTKSSA